MAKQPKRTQKVPPTSVFIVIDSEGIQLQRDTYGEAYSEASKLCDDGHSDVKILEVVKAWCVEFPEEPMPEAYDLQLENIT